MKDEGCFLLSAHINWTVGSPVNTQKYLSTDGWGLFFSATSWET